MRHQKENWYLLNTGVQQPSIVLGISGKVHELVNLGRCIEDDIPLIKRFSGGRPFVLMYSTWFSVRIYFIHRLAHLTWILHCHYDHHLLELVLLLAMIDRRYCHCGSINLVRNFHPECKHERLSLFFLSSICLFLLAIRFFPVIDDTEMHRSYTLLHQFFGRFNRNGNGTS